MDNTSKTYSAVMIDDEIWALRGLKGIINWEEYHIHILGTYTDSRKALQDILTLQPDIVFTDIRMPDIDGVELIKKLTEYKLSTKVIIVTAYEDFEIARMALRNNVIDYLIKPLDRQEVKNTAMQLYKTLSAQKTKSFSLSDYDLSDKSVQSLPNVSKYLQSLLTSEMYVVLSEVALSGEHMTSIYIKGFPHAYLCQQLPNITSVPKDSRIGISRVIRSFDTLSEQIKEAKMSFFGSFLFSSNELTSNIQKYIYENLSQKLSIEDIAGHFYLSKSYIYELFRNHTDTSAINFVRNIRLANAAHLLLTQRASIQEIASQVGFEEQGYFSRQFKNKYGCTPEKYAATKH